MIFIETTFPEVFLVGLEPKSDYRGTFARAFCANEFGMKGLETQFVQANISNNKIAGTVRGLHCQCAPFEEVKIIRCIVGSVYDVVVDIREDSPTFKQWFCAELSQDNGLMMYVPRGFAHGYQTISDNATVQYMVSAYYVAESERGYRYDDPSLNIDWPLPVSAVSEKDASWPLIQMCEKKWNEKV
jgi:dTDP-4-dehydrorhamnose 3,5-epimerase